MSGGVVNKTRRPVVVCYQPRPEAAAVSQKLCEELHNSCLDETKRCEEFLVPRRQGRAWKLLKGQICRVSLVEGSQVGDLNFWNLHNRKERFYSGKTRQIQKSHLTTGDRLWSCMPYLRPMATIVHDSICYGIDEDGANIQDVIGTRCDPYTFKAMTGRSKETPTCHTNLTEAVKPFGLKEEDVHDVFNIFMCSGFTKNTQEYFVKASPARSGDCIEISADMDLLVALSACPQGDVSLPTGTEMPEDRCYPLQVAIYQP